MRTGSNVSRGWALRHPQAKKQRDVTIHFECVSRDCVRVAETVDGNPVSHRILPRDPEIVTELEKKYMFFADEADIARKLVQRGRSFDLSVYFRQA
jgi:hypothetical protein